MPRPRKTRDHYAHFDTITPRWRDNDVYGHVNNAVFYEYVDTCVNAWLIRSGALLVPAGDVIGLVVETACVYHESLAFPDPVGTGLRVSRIGTSSVTYEIGLFRGDAAEAAAEARFTHVYVDRETMRPTPIPDRFRDKLGGLRMP